MATTAPGIITVDELRSEIGSPTADPREAAGVSDQELRDLIDREAKAVERTVLSRLEKRVMNSNPPSSSHILDREEIELKEEAIFAVGPIPDGYYPLTFESGSNGARLFTFDSNLETHTAGYFDRHRFNFRGQRVFVLPKTTDKITLSLPVKEKANRTIGADAIREVNASIKEQALQMVQRKAQVGGDLEQSDLDQ